MKTHTNIMELFSQIIICSPHELRDSESSNTSCGSRPCLLLNANFGETPTLDPRWLDKSVYDYRSNIYECRDCNGGRVNRSDNTTRERLGQLDDGSAFRVGAFNGSSVLACRDNNLGYCG
jgi:hypothetical protein